MEFIDTGDQLSNSNTEEVVFDRFGMSAIGWQKIMSDKPVEKREPRGLALLPELLLHDARSIIATAQFNAVRSVEFHRVEMYWKLGERIFVEEQQEQQRAEYGSYLIANLALELEREFGRGFSKRQLERARQFYRLYPIASALRTQLNWFQYRLLISIPDADKREYYQLEALKNRWNGKELERQINAQLYERLLLSNDKEAVMAVARSERLPETATEIIKDPMVLEFLGLEQKPTYKWYEAPFSTVGMRWGNLNDGGESRKWYGNLESVIDWKDGGAQIRNHKSAVISVVLNNYLREYRVKLTAQKENLEALSISKNADNSAKTRALKEIEKLRKVIEELNDYERDILYPLATQQIDIDLDDGVKVNYVKFGKALKKIPGFEGNED